MLEKLEGKFILTGDIVCITGLHIGGTTTGIEIGGVDNAVIKDPLKDQPYIPGSALKGKLRSITEWSLGLIAQHPKHKSYGAYDCHELQNDCPPSGSKEFDRWQKAYIVGRLYGAANDDGKVRSTSGPSRLTVRDSFLDEETVAILQDTMGRGVFTEVKTENALDRVTSEATPRPIERVPAGSKFTFILILDRYQPEDNDLFREVFAAMHLLEHSALGGSGSRGHGQITFENLKLVWRSLDYYLTSKPEQLIELPGDTLKNIVENYTSIKMPG